jgi:hypothetical protein
VKISAGKDRLVSSALDLRYNEGKIDFKEMVIP